MIRSSIQELLAQRAKVVVVLGLLLGTLSWCAPTAVAAGTPEWQLTMTHLNPFGAEREQCKSHHAEPLAEPPCGIDPLTEHGSEAKGETFARESGYNHYTLTVKNVGTANSAGTITVNDFLPEGMLIMAEQTEHANIPTWKCVPEAGSAPRAVKCQTTADVKPEATLHLTLFALVKEQAGRKENPVKDTSTVEGGGAASSAAAESETTITEAVPFGVTKFSTELHTEPKEPPGATEGLLRQNFPPEAFTEAGAHPFAVSTEIIMNYTTGEEGGFTEPTLVPAGGGAKEVQAELPPGFLGDVLSKPQCPIELVHEKACPSDTAVGYTRVNTKGGSIREGVVNVSPSENELVVPSELGSLVYNLVPPPGTPAALGFLVAGGVPFILDAKLRSGGDYGVTVGDSAVGEKPVSVKLTICEDGAHVRSNEAEFKEGSLCYKPEEPFTPFLTTPSACTLASSSWTARTDPWLKPEDYVFTTAHTSELTGCENVKFTPELEFVPSLPREMGTAQADEPTGITVGLKVPQSGGSTQPALKDLEMTLPQGVTASPAGAGGLTDCTNARFWPTTKAEQQEAAHEPVGEPPLNSPEQQAAEHREPAVAAKCPLASQIGTVEVFTPLLSAAPTIRGTPEKGSELSCTHGTWSVAPEETSYQWLRNGSAIQGATGEHYNPVAADEEKELQCQVTAGNSGGASVAISRGTAVGHPEGAHVNFEIPVPLPFLTSTLGPPSGNASVGSILACPSGTWAHSESLSYQWLRAGIQIAGATTSAYTLAAADAGEAIQCQVTGTGAGGHSVADSGALLVASQAASPAPPLPGGALQGQVFVGAPECSPCNAADAEAGRILRLLIQIQDPAAGLLVKVHGVSKVNQETGQLTTIFENQPQQPFELLRLNLKGGPRAPLANPQTCGPVVTTSRLTPWSEPFAEPARPQSEYKVVGCPSTAEFGPTFNAGTVGPNATSAAAFTQFSLTLERQDRQQDLSGVEVKMPPGLAGVIADVKECGEAEVHAAERDEGECPAESQLGTATAGAGPGPHPFFQKGKVYLTGPYKNSNAPPGAAAAPFGIAIVTPAVAGPFNLGKIVVRSTINVDSTTAAVTVMSDPLPQFRDGVQLRLRSVNVEVNRQDFMFNPTNCAEHHIAATLTGQALRSGEQSKSALVSSTFGMRGCASLPFAPDLTAQVDNQGSKVNGIGFRVNVTSAGLGQANIAKTFLTIPKILPARLQPTLQHACLAATFAANPAGCPEDAVIGTATVHTPVLKNPLTGPAYIVSHGGAAFPDVEFVLQGEGVEILLDGKTDIKKGVTYSRFEATPDAPFTSFETTFPAGPHSIFTPNTEIVPTYNLCGQTISLPTEITGQNGKVIKQNTSVAITGCHPAVRITHTKLKGNKLVVTIATNAAGTVRISGAGLRTTTQRVSAEPHQIAIHLTKAGIALRKRHGKTKVRVRFTVGTTTLAKATTVRL